MPHKWVRRASKILIRREVDEHGFLGILFGRWGFKMEDHLRLANRSRIPLSTGGLSRGGMSVSFLSGW